MQTSESLTARWLLLVVATAALIVGIYARFKGLAAAPLSVDEYYLVRSIDNVLRSGVPVYPCGGYYTRGLILQYLSAALRLTGVSATLAPRILAALSSLLVLPAAYLLGRRVHGRSVGLLAVIVLALSVWEIEMARFGRMYAPFQPVCAWYLVFFVRYSVDRDAKALWPMLALSVLAPFVWEGGALLALLNLLPLFLQQAPEIRLSAAHWRQLIGAVLLFVAAYWFVVTDFRGFNAASWPPGFTQSLTVAPTDPLSLFPPLSPRLREHAGWAALGIVPVIASLYALRGLWAWRRQPVTALGLLAVLLAALLHAFTAVIGIALLLLLMRLTSTKQLFARDARPLHIAIALSALFWLAFGIATTDWHRAAGSLPRTLAAFAYPYLQFPDFIGVVVRPWMRAVPILAVGLFVLVTVAMLRQARSDEPLTAERALLVALLLLLLAASASHPPRQETRYVFFLYPLAVIIALASISRGAQWLLPRLGAAPLATCLIGLSAFALSEDFQPHHLYNIDRPDEIFRSNMNLDMQAHLEIRNDYRNMARWLQQRVAPGDVVINGVHGLDYYYPQINYFFADELDPDMPSWSCLRGSVERWGNYPLIYSVDTLKSQIAAGQSTYLIFYPTNNPGLLTALAPFAPQVVWSQGFVSIVVLHGMRP